MSLLRALSKKRLDIASAWLSSAAVYGGTAGGLIVFFTDWRVITDFIPFYNGKYPKEE